MKKSKPIPMSDAAASIAAMEQEFNLLQRQIRLAIQDRLAKFAGQSIGDLELNQRWVTAIHQLLENHGLRVRCNECGHPAILRVSARSGAPTGVFVFDHTVDGRRTFHGGRGVMPPLVLVAKPPRKKKRPAAGASETIRDRKERAVPGEPDPLDRVSRRTG